jgi:hypothetical protein
MPGKYSIAWTYMSSEKESFGNWGQNGMSRERASSRASSIFSWGKIPIAVVDKFPQNPSLLSI